MDFKIVAKVILVACSFVSVVMAMLACGEVMSMRTEAGERHKEAQALARELADTLARQKDKRETERAEASAKARALTEEGEEAATLLPALAFKPGAPPETAMLTPLEVFLLASGSN